MSEWISVRDELPKIDFEKPKYLWQVRVIGFDGKSIREVAYSSNGYAKTENGSLPRFEETSGKLAVTRITHWMPLPEAPKPDTL